MSGHKVMLRTGSAVVHKFFYNGWKQMDQEITKKKCILYGFGSTNDDITNQLRPRFGKII